MKSTINIFFLKVNYLQLFTNNLQNYQKNLQEAMGENTKAHNLPPPSSPNTLVIIHPPTNMQ
eukprot:Pgem_evm1s18463